MTASRVGSNVKWILFPLVYAASLVPVTAAGVATAAMLERPLGCHYTCEVGGLFVLLVVSTLVFALLPVAFIRSMPLRPPQWRDHLHLCSGLYTIMALLAFDLVVNYSSLSGSLGYGLEIALFCVAGYAVLINAVIVQVTRQRSARSS